MIIHREGAREGDTGAEKRKKLTSPPPEVVGNP